MTYEKIRSLSPEERDIKIKEEQESLRKLRFAHAVSPLDRPLRIRVTRRLIARLKTAQSMATRAD